MKIKRETASEIYSFSREFLITFSGLYGIFIYLGWEIPALLLFFISLFISVNVKLVGNYKIKKLIIIIPITLLLIILTLEVFLNINFLLFFQKAFSWNYSYINGIGDFQLSYSILSVCILSFIMVKVVFYLEKNIISEFMMAIALLGLMVLCGINNIQWNPLIIAIMLFCCLDIIVEIYQVKIGGTERYAERCLVPFILVAALLAIYIPSNEDPIRWIWVRETVSDIKDNVKEFVYNLEWTDKEDKNEFNVNKAGFSEEGDNSFGKLIDERERNMLSISTRSNLKVEYLSGIILSTYTGSEWKKEENDYGDYTDEYRMDLYEKLYNLYNSGLVQSPDEYFARKIYYQIAFDKLETKTVFRPENCYTIDDFKNNINVETVGNNVYFTNKEKKGYSYYVSALIMNMNNENLRNYLKNLNENEQYYKEEKNGQADLENSLFEKSISQLKLSEEQIAYITSDNFRQRLFKRSERIKEEYLQIPKGTPGRVKELAEDLTKDYTNQYDKAEAIRRYLKENYPYTTNIDQLPDGKDAVDYFLFERKKGYCTYFASAMAIMCRSIGIPVRYVEGATIDYKEMDEEWYKVKTGSAHAWTEIYLEGFGWIRMDATPGYSDNSINWSVNGEGWQRYGNQTSTTSSNKLKSVVQESETQAEENDYNAILWLKYLLVGIIWLLIFASLGVGLFIWNKKRIYKKSNNREKVLICMKKILSNLEKQGYVLKQGETLKDFRERLEEDENWNNIDMIKLLEWFQNIRYSKKEVTEEEVIWVEQFLVKSKI